MSRPEAALMEAAPLCVEVDEAGALAVVEDPALAAGMPVAVDDVVLVRLGEEVARDAFEVGRAVREADEVAPPVTAVTAVH